MGEELQNKIYDFQEKSACEEVDYIMAQAIDGLDDGLITEADVLHLFSLYELAKQIKSTQEIFIGEVTRLLKTELKKDIENCQQGNFPTPLTEEVLLKDASITEFPKFETYEAFIASDFFQKYYDLGDKEMKADWFWGLGKRPQLKVVSFPGIDYELPEDPRILERWKGENGVMYYKILTNYPITGELKDSMRNHVIGPAPIPEEEQQIAHNIQRMLIAMGYMSFDDFDTSQGFGEGHTRNETDISYFGILGKLERRAIKQFQRDIGFPESRNPKENQVDGIIGGNTRPFFYRRMYELFHKKT